VNKAPPPVTKKVRPLPGEEYETAKPLPPLENVVNELPPAATEPPLANEQAPVNANEVAPPEQTPPLPPGNSG
jgi:monofunctional biosynthetic peptidoglycan transglycosylase